MQDCELIAGCPFFNDQMATRPALVNMYKITYCIEDNSQCARYLVYKQFGREKVPLDLCPHMIEEAKAILARK
jgi:hypothetical protein